MVDEIAAGLLPGYFSLVMATGALSIALEYSRHSDLAGLLLGINIVAYAALGALTLLRIVRFFPRVIADLGNHAVGAGFFTAVAGTCVLGSQLVVVVGAANAARWLWFLGVFLWIAITYGFFFAVVIRDPKPRIEAGISGTWLLAPVATQAISVLASLTASTMGAGEQIVLFVAVDMYLLGAALYLIIITLIFYRFAFGKVTAASMSPPYWINMGAVAISTLAGSTLMLRAGQWGFIGELLPFIRGFTLFFWAIASWWIPLLALIGIWRHLWKSHAVRYEPDHWSMVFPLAMYAAATDQLGQSEQLGFLSDISDVFVFIAAAAWLVVFAGLVTSLARAVRTTVRRAHGGNASRLSREG